MTILWDAQERRMIRTTVSSRSSRETYSAKMTLLDGAGSSSARLHRVPDGTLAGVAAPGVTTASAALVLAGRVPEFDVGRRRRRKAASELVVGHHADCSAT